MNFSKTGIVAKPNRVPVAEIIWAVVSIGSLGLLLRCLAAEPASSIYDDKHPRWDQG